MEGISTRKFYGDELRQRSNTSIKLVATTLRRDIFKCLRFPVRQKSKAVIRVPVLPEDQAFFAKSSVDTILQCSGMYSPRWNCRVISPNGDENYVVPSECEVKVAKVRGEAWYIRGGDGAIDKRKREHGLELKITLYRYRRSGLGAQ